MFVVNQILRNIIQRNKIAIHVVLFIVSQLRVPLHSDHLKSEITQNKLLTNRSVATKIISCTFTFTSACDVCDCLHLVRSFTPAPFLSHDLSKRESPGSKFGYNLIQFFSTLKNKGMFPFDCIFR